MIYTTYTSPYTTFIINLDHRTDRYQKITKHLDSSLILSNLFNIKRLPAFKAPEDEPGWIYCALSHIEAVKLAKKLNLPFIIVLEDDCVFHLNQLDNLPKILNWLTINLDSWDIFNGNPTFTYEKNPPQEFKLLAPFITIVQYFYGLTANFIIYNRSIYDQIISNEYIYHQLKKKRDSNSYHLNAFDKIINKSSYRLVTSIPFISYQDTGYSDIEHQINNYDSFIKKSQYYILNRLHQQNYLTSKIIGGLGNQLFIIAFAYVLNRRSSDHRLVFLIQKNFYPCKARSINDYWTTMLKGLFFINDCYSKPQFKIKENLKDPEKNLIIPQKNTFYTGYFQNAYYFNGFEDEIRNLFRIPDELKETLYQKYSFIQNNNITVSVHVRRGDYIKLKHFHHLIPLIYYEKAFQYMINKLGSKILFVVFSDDIDWCKKNFSTNYNYYFITNEDDYKEMYLMSLCQHHIIANSTFSWWGVYLNDNSNKIKLAPCKWFEDKNQPYPSGLIYKGYDTIIY